jgi:hypothetical protein
MGTAVGLSQEREEFRTENIDVELHVIEWPVEYIVESRPYDADLYREHFAFAYRGDRSVQFNDVEPAYRFGHELRVSIPERDWLVVAPIACATWEKSSPRTWEHFAPAVRHAWQRGGG